MVRSLSRGRYLANWCRILSASRVPEFGLLSNRTIMRQGIIEPVQVQRAIDFKVRRPEELS